MRVLLLSDRVGGGRIDHAGETIELPDGEAHAAIAGGYAEAAIVEPTETATRRTSKARKKASRRPSS